MSDVWVFAPLPPEWEDEGYDRDDYYEDEEWDDEYDDEYVTAWQRCSAAVC